MSWDRLNVKVICAYVILINILSASPSIIGGRGLFKVEDAITEDIGVVSISTFLLTHNTESGIYYSDLIVPNISYTPANFMQVFFWGGRILRSDLVFPEIWKSNISSDPHDRMIGGKASFSLLPVFKLGAKIAYAWPRKLSDNSVIETNKGLNWTGLASFRFSDLYNALPNIMFNYGENSDLRKYGAGFEIEGSGGSIFVEATSSKEKTGGIFDGFLDNLTVTPGIKLNTGQYSCLSGGVIIDVKNNPDIPNYTAIVGLTLGGAILKPPQEKLGIITGTVTDFQTGASLRGTLNFPEKPKLKAVQSNPQTGIFKAEKIPAGIIAVEINAEGYQKQIQPIAVEANKINAYDFKLKPSVSYGVIAGNVYDAVTKKPIDANISFSNNILPEIKSDSTTGSFKIEKVRTGVFTMEAKKDGYFPKAVTVSVEDGKITQVDLSLTASITQAIFNGKISIKESGEPLAAQITFLNKSLAPILSDSITGVFQAQIPIGTYSVNITDSGFLPYTGVVTIEQGKTNQFDFELIPSQFQTIITGKVSDKKTGTALSAIVSFPEAGIQPTITDSINGIYRIEVPVGTYLIDVKSNNYITQTAMIVLEKNKPLEKNFEMVKQGMVITLKGIYFESGKSTLKPESYSALQDAAKILTDNPDIKVEIQGHTDSVGSDSYNQTLSEKRAYAIMNYLVTSLGITPERLSAKGYGELKPIASNDTEEGRALNRRVDFIILGK